MKRRTRRPPGDPAAKPRALHTHLGPPLAVPVAFFLLAPVAVVAAGGILAMQGSAALTSRWTPSTVALVHLGTLGLLATTMMGVLHQMAPVVAGSVVGASPLARALPALLAGGVAALVVGLLEGVPAVWIAAVLILGGALVAFVAPVGLALLRAPIRDETVRGMRLALLSLVGVGALGLWMAWARAGGEGIEARGAWVQAHVVLGLLGWIGGLIGAVSWKVVPMFYAARPVPTAWTRGVRWTLAVGLVSSVLAPALGVQSAWAAAPAAVAVWGLQPALTLWSLRHRRSRRTDASLCTWRLAMGTALLLLPLSALASISSDPAWPVLLGWLALWGWAGALVHGMLTRIVPFLVWLHRFAPVARSRRVRRMGELLPARRAHAGLWLHAISVVVGAAAILTGSDPGARVAGILLAASGAALLVTVVHVLRQRPAEPSHSSAEQGWRPARIR